MKAFISTLAIAAALAAPALTYAQSNTTTTRAQVRAELIQLEKAGYRVGDGDSTQYPTQILAAEARVAAQQGTPSGRGGIVGASSDAGRPTRLNTEFDPTYNRP